MKKVVKAKKRAPTKARGVKRTTGPARGSSRSRTVNTSRKLIAKLRAKRIPGRSPKRRSKSVARMAARVLSRRAAANAAKLQPQTVAPRNPIPAPAPSAPVARSRKAHQPQRPRPSRPAAPLYRANREVVRVSRVPQFTYMRAPGSESAFNVGDPVEVFCDHELDGERVRGWVKGVVVQVDNKLVAVQFRSNVFLTDGWMVPDRILWYSLSSDQIRAAGLGKRTARKAIPEY